MAVYPTDSASVLFLADRHLICMRGADGHDFTGIMATGREQIAKIRSL